METDVITIRLKGYYDIRKLSSLGFRKINRRWLFIGQRHQYIFTPGTADGLLITIKERPKDWRTDYSRGIPYQITFGQIKDWVGKCIEAIAISTQS